MKRIMAMLILSSLLLTACTVPDENANCAIEQSGDISMDAVESGEIFDPYNEQEFFECVQQFGIEEPTRWMSLDTLSKTPFERDKG